MKKLILFILIFTLAFSNLLMGVSAAETPTLSLNVSSDQIERSEELTLSVEVENNPGVCAFMFTITYDDNAFNIVSGGSSPEFEMGENFDPYMISMANEKNGKLAYTFVASGAADTTANGTLVTFKFKAKKKTGAYSFQITRTNNSAFAGNGNQQEVDFEIKDAVVVVGEKSSTSSKETSSSETVSEQVSNEQTSSEEIVVEPPVVTSNFKKTVTLEICENSYQVPQGVEINVGDTVVLPRNSVFSINGENHYLNSFSKFIIKRNGKTVFNGENKFSFTISQRGTYTYHVVKWGVPNVSGNGAQIVKPFAVETFSANATPELLPFDIVTQMRNQLRQQKNGNFAQK